MALVDFETVVVVVVVFAVVEAVVGSVAAAAPAASTIVVLESSAIYQNGAASLYSLGSRVKKSSSFHWSVSKVGRRIGSLFQHSSIIS